MGMYERVEGDANRGQLRPTQEIIESSEQHEPQSESTESIEVFSEDDFLHHLDIGQSEQHLNKAHGDNRKWPRYFYLTDSLAQSKYATPEGISWLLKYVDTLPATESVSDKLLHTEPGYNMREIREGIYKKFKNDNAGAWNYYLDKSYHDVHDHTGARNLTGRTINENWYQEVEVMRFVRDHADESNIEDLVNFSKRNLRSTFFRAEMVEIFNRTNPAKAAAFLLREIQHHNTETNDIVATRRTKDLARTLFRLELGRVGISSQGVEYLGKRFDVGEFNSADNFVQRLTPNGDLGVYDNERVLRGTFNVGDLTKNEEVVRAEVLAITNEMLFTPRADETEQDRAMREHILREFVEKHHAFYDVTFQEQTGIHIGNLSLKEQGWFMHFMQQADDVTRERAYLFARQYHEDGFRTFLAAEYGDEIGNRILELGETLEPTDARELFKVFGTTLDNAEALRHKLQARGAMSEASEVPLERIIDQTYEALVRRSKDMLLAAHEIGVRKQNDTELTLDHVHVALSGLNVLLELLHGLDSTEAYAVEILQTQKQEWHTVVKYRIVDPAGFEYGLKILARPLESRNSDGSIRAEARVNIELDFDTAHPHPLLREAFYSNTTYPEQKKCVERHALRLGIDRDTHYENGRVSLDLGRGNHASETLTRQGDVVGRLLQLVSVDGSHNTASFDAEFGKPKTFAKIVTLLSSHLTTSRDHSA